MMKITKPLLHNVNTLEALFQGNHMMVHLDKYQCIVIDKYDNIGNLPICDILPEDNVTILELQVDNKLHFYTQITQICQKVGKK